MENTQIEWADHTFNPWVGCQKVSPACDHCYAERWDRRFAVSGHVLRWGAQAKRARTSIAYWRYPYRWDDAASDGYFVQCTGCGRRGDARTWEKDIRAKNPEALTCCPDRNLVPVRPRVFCASLADVFDNAVPQEWRDDLLTLIAQTPSLDWLLLTKRISNARPMLAQSCTMAEHANPTVQKWTVEHPWPNEHTPTQKWPGIDWVICGGESGPKARPMHPDWVRSLRDQCQTAGVPFFFKQWGEWWPGEPCRIYDAEDQACWTDGTPVIRLGKKAAGRILDDRTWDEYPLSKCPSCNGDGQKIVGWTMYSGFRHAPCGQCNHQTK